MMIMIAIWYEMSYFACILPEQTEDASDLRITHHLNHIVRELSLFSYSDPALRFLGLIELLQPASSKKIELSYKVDR